MDVSGTVKGTEMPFDGRVWQQDMRGLWLAVESDTLEPITTSDALLASMEGVPRSSFVMTRVVNGWGIIDTARKHGLRILVDPHTEETPEGRRVQRWGEIVPTVEGN